MKDEFGDLIGCSMRSGDIQSITDAVTKIVMDKLRRTRSVKVEEGRQGGVSPEAQRKYDAKVGECQARAMECAKLKQANADLTREKGRLEARLAEESCRQEERYRALDAECEAWRRHALGLEGQVQSLEEELRAKKDGVQVQSARAGEPRREKDGLQEELQVPEEQLCGVGNQEVIIISDSDGESDGEPPRAQPGKGAPPKLWSPGGMRRQVPGSDTVKFQAVPLLKYSFERLKKKNVASIGGLTPAQDWLMRCQNAHGRRYLLIHRESNLVIVVRGDYFNTQPSNQAEFSGRLTPLVTKDWKTWSFRDIFFENLCAVGDRPHTVEGFTHWWLRHGIKPNPATKRRAVEEEEAGGPPGDGPGPRAPLPSIRILKRLRNK